MRGRAYVKPSFASLSGVNCLAAILSRVAWRIKAVNEAKHAWPAGRGKSIS